MTRERINFLFLNLGHFYDHLFMLLFATVAALTLSKEMGLSYAELIPYAVPGFVAFGAGAVPAGWLADRWSRPGMLIIFFIGIGLSSALASLARTPLEIGAGLFLIGIFASIYHPVGIAMVVEGREKTGVPLAINGIFGNMGVACAALLAGVLIDFAGWRAAFLVPAAAAVATGLAYAAFRFAGREADQGQAAQGTAGGAAETGLPGRRVLLWVFSIIFFSTACGSLIFQATTFSLPKVFDERLADLANNATQIGSWAFVVFTIAAFAQLPVGHLIDRYSIRTVFAVVVGLQVPMFLLIVNLSGAPALIVSVAFMLLVFGQIPINDALLARFSKSSWRSRAYSLKFIIGFTISATAVPMIALLHKTGGFAALFSIIAAVAGVMFLVVLLLPRDGLTAAPGLATQQ
ncbi:MAG: MFS transporter [SAR324 cluster bacterium]|nr:MFS transporter [SAR324 cluster bacterium]